MTISSTTVITRTLTNGSAHTFSFGHPFQHPDDLIVWLVTISDWSVALQVRDTHYEVSNNGNEDEVGGTITFINELQAPTAPADGKICVILRRPGLVQDLNTSEAKVYPPVEGEAALDRLYQVIQFVEWRTSRAIRLNDSFSDADLVLPDVDTRKGKAIGFDANGDLALYNTAAEIEAAIQEALLAAQGFASAAGVSASTAEQYANEAIAARNAAVVAQEAAEDAQSTAEGAASTATSQAIAASVSADRSEDWAIKTDGIVESTDYAAKAWAIGGTGVTDTAARGAAKEWATKAEDSTVDGTGYSALHWAAKAEDYKTAAELAESNAASSESAASGYASAASGSASDASGYASDASGSASAASGYADAASGSASAASGSASDASGYADAASNSASDASGYASAASGSASTASGYADDASGYASTASGHASDASGYASAAQGHANDASGYASAASGYADAAAGSASTASGHASDASGYASAASGSASAASGSASAASGYADAAAASFDAFDDIYLGAKSSDPTLDNDGDALVSGQLYWNTSAGNLRVYDGASWNVYSAASGMNNLVDDTSPDLGGALNLNGNGRLYDATNTNLAVFGMTNSGGTPNGAYFQVFGNNYTTSTQRGGAEFVFDSQNSGTGGFTVFEYDGANWTPRLKVDVGGGVSADSLAVDDEAYDATDWNGSLEVPTKNAVRDKIESILTNYASTATSFGASLIGIEDAGGLITATTVEAALAELAADVAALDAAVVLKGTWDASGGSFPGSGTAQAGWSYIVSVGGTVDGVAFTANDRILAVTDNASTSTFAANWHKLDYTDQVLSVAGKTGAVTLAHTDISGLGTLATLSSVDLAANVTGDLPFANLAQGSALSVLGVTGNATADVASIAAASNHQVLRRSGTSVAFGAVALNQANAVTGTLPPGNLPAATETAIGAIELAVDSEVRGATAGNLAVTPSLIQSASAAVSMSDASTITFDWSAGIYRTVAIGDNRTLGNPTSGQPGTFRTILVSASSGTRTLVFGNQYGGELPTLNDITTSKKYLLTVFCKTSTEFLVTAIDGSDA